MVQQMAPVNTALLLLSLAATEPAEPAPVEPIEPVEAVEAVEAPEAQPAAPAQNTEAPDVKNIATIAGGSALASGVVIFGLASIPGFLHGAAENDLSALRVRYLANGGDPATLQEAAQKQRDVDDLRDLHNGVGIAGLWTGALLAIAGAGVLAAALGGLLDDASMTETP